MRRSYIFIYSGKVGTRDEVREFIDNLPSVQNWLFEIPNSFYLVSENSASELADMVIQFAGGKGTFLITEYVDNSEGLLGERSWAVLNEKELPGNEEDDS